MEPDRSSVHFSDRRSENRISSPKEVMSKGDGGDMVNVPSLA